MSVSTAMTAIADRIRGLLGLSGAMGLEAMASHLEMEQTNVSNAFAAVSNLGGTVPESQVSGNLASAIGTIPLGVTVQRASGTFTTSTSGTATVNCGFQPDLFIVDEGGAYSTWSYTAAFPFYEIQRSATINVPLWGAGSTDYDIYATINGSAISIKITNMDSNAAVKNATFSYIAVKYT